MTLEIKRVAIDSLTPDPQNARTHGGTNLSAIRASLKTFGQVEPLVVQRGTGRVIGGNGRLEVLRSDGATEVDVVEVDVEDDGARALGVALNRTGELASWDGDQLRALIDSVALDGFSFDDIGLDDAALNRLIGSVAPPQDSVPEPPEKAVTQPGDIWTLGPHRIICGDATDVDVVTAVFAGAAPALMVTDPPYGVSYDPAWRHRAGFNKSDRRQEITNDEIADWQKAYDLFGGPVAYVSLQTDVVVESMRRSGLERRALIIWVKQKIVFGRGHYHWRHENCWYGVRKGRTAGWIGDRKQSTVWEIDAPIGAAGNDDDASTFHATQKPIECMARPIRNHEGDVYDPFLGSGTTLIAAEQLGRTCFGVELEPRYVDVAVQRWENLTGGKATRRQA